MLNKTEITINKINIIPNVCPRSKNKNEPNSVKLPIGEWFKIKAIHDDSGYYQFNELGVWRYDGLNVREATVNLHKGIITFAKAAGMTLKDIIAAAQTAGAALKDIIAAAQAAGASLKDIIAAAQAAGVKQDDAKFWKVFEEHIDIIGCVCSGKGNIILHGPPGTSKTHSAKEIANLLVCLGNESTRSDKNLRIVQFHPSTTYEDFIRGIRAKTVGENIAYEAENAIFGQMCAAAAPNPNNYFVLIVDEINRANLPSVFGELIFALEYRGEAVNTPYEVNSSKELTVPQNLVVIGTMNTADRSVGQMDYAIRRRFQFFPLLPDVQKVTVSDAKKTFQNVLRLFVKTPTTSPIDWSDRADTLSNDFRASDVAIGHTYFLGEDWRNSFKFQVLPMLVEYLKDGVLLESSNIKDETPCSKIEKIHFETLDKPAKDVVSKFDNLFIKQGGA